eukprot:COSAG02_NODE_516_length_20804_cov_162.717460_12_plen_192_part_00
MAGTCVRNAVSRMSTCSGRRTGQPGSKLRPVNEGRGVSAHLPNMRNPKHIVIGLRSSRSRSPGPDRGPFFVKYWPYACDIGMPRDHPSSAVALAVTTPDTAARKHSHKCDTRNHHKTLPLAAVEATISARRAASEGVGPDVPMIGWSPRCCSDTGSRSACNSELSSVENNACTATPIAIEEISILFCGQSS